MLWQHTSHETLTHKSYFCLHKVHCLSRAASLQRVPQGSKLIPSTNSIISTDNPMTITAREASTWGLKPSLLCLAPKSHGLA